MATLKVKKLNAYAILPTRGTDRSAGYDLYALSNCQISPAEGSLVYTGISVAIPQGYYGRIAPRSSLALKGINVGGGVIDEDYRGEIKVILFNHGNNVFQVNQGERIAQLILTKIITPDVEEVDELDATKRADGGFGSTGK